MLTPAFDLSQNEEFLIVSIQVPYAKLSEVEVHFEDNDFMFYCKPYHLRLNLPGKVVYQEDPSIKYDFDKRIFTITAPKFEKGEVFEGLDLVTLLLAKKKEKIPSAPLIEVLEGSNDEVNDEEFDWTIEQVPAEDEFGNITFCGQQCGFNNSYSFSVFNLKEEAEELFEVTEPQKKTPKIRTEERLIAESKKFDEDHYIADLYQDEEIQALIKYNPMWNGVYEELQSNSSTSADDKISFTSEEKEQLRKLPNKEYLLDKAQAKSTLLGLIDILFAYAYNKRTTEGENTVGSAWVINKLSATLSWLEVFPSLQETAATCIRRSLIYPLFRHFELSVTVLEDVVKIMKLGRKYVMKCLLEIHKLFCENEPMYILNDLYIIDYIVWTQSKRCSSTTFLSLAQALEKVLLTKGDIGLNLVDIESFAKIAWMAHENNLFNSTKSKKKHKSSGTNSSNRSRNSTESALVSGMEKISLDSKSNGSENEESASDSDEASSCEIYESYTSDSSDGCSSVSGSDCCSDDTDEDSETSSGTDSDEDDSSNSDNNSYSCLIRKELYSERIL